MNKPVVIDRPWWRHPAFPWGWLSLRMDINPRDSECVTLSGYNIPEDDGNGSVYYPIMNQSQDDGGTIIVPSGGCCE